jgi:uracil-DNA glycosylase
MVVGEYPGRDDEKAGRVFAGKNGGTLRMALEQAGLESVTYLTNSVACRSCAQGFDNNGEPKVWVDRRTGRQTPAILDKSPELKQREACLPRLYEEIYIVDPVVIVALGETAATTLLKRSVKILSEAGTLHTIEVPGAGRNPVLTEKRKQWTRKVHGTWVSPTEQNMVLYPCFVSFDTSYVYRNLDDRRPKNPLERFSRMFALIRTTYESYMIDVYGKSPLPPLQTQYQETDDER